MKTSDLQNSFRTDSIRLYIIVILLSVASLCSSQEKDSLMLRQEVSIGIGTPSFFDLLAKITTWGDYKPGPEAHLQYLYNVNKCVGLGAMSVFEYYEAHRSNEHGVLITFNPVARFYWFNKQNFAMYSKIGAGVCVGIVIEDEVETIPMINILPVGIEFGGRKWRGFTEIFPIGTVGVFNGGIKYIF